MSFRNGTTCYTCPVICFACITGLQPDPTRDASRDVPCHESPTGLLRHPTSLARLCCWPVLTPFAVTGRAASMPCVLPRGTGLLNSFHSYTARKGIVGQGHAPRFRSHANVVSPEGYIASCSQPHGTGAPRTTKLSKVILKKTVAVKCTQDLSF